MELKVTHPSREHNDIVPTVVDAASALRQVLASASAPTMAELAACADPHGPYGDDVTSFGSLAANMLSGSKRVIVLASSNEKERVFRQVAATMAGAAKEQFITKEVMISRLQSIAEEHGRFGLSPEQLNAVIAGATAPSPTKGREPAEAAAAPAQSRRLITHRASDLEPEELVWVWPGRIAEGKLCLLGGPPGLGKSQLTAFVSATVSTGGQWPCDEGTTTAGSVIFMSAEDGIEDTIVPRLMAAGADRDRVHIVRAATKPDGTGRKTFSLKTDVDLLEKKAKEIGDVRLIVVDPISAYMGGADGNGNVETREVLEPLAEMANRLRIAVLAVTHLNKGGGGGQTAMNRFCGSIAYIAAARTAFLVVADAENSDRRLLLQAKNNLAKDCKGLVFRLEQRLVKEGIVSSNVIFFDEQVSASVDEALTAFEGRGRNGGRNASAKLAAVELLKEVLANGPVGVEEVERQARQAGFLDDGKRIGKVKVFNDACAALGVVRKRVGFGQGAHYVWSLPEASCASETNMRA
jgi:putative DNA primase/helicase